MVEIPLQKNEDLTVYFDILPEMTWKRFVNAEKPAAVPLEKQPQKLLIFRAAAIVCDSSELFPGLLLWFLIASSVTTSPLHHPQPLSAQGVNFLCELTNIKAKIKTAKQVNFCWIWYLIVYTVVPRRIVSELQLPIDFSQNLMQANSFFTSLIPSTSL